jgi:gluconate kinase
MYELAAELLPQQHSLIFDGIHLGRKDRDALRRFAERYGVESKIVYTTAVPHIIQERLQARIQSPEQTSAEGKFVIMPDHFLKLASYLEPPADDEDVVVIDTSQGLLDENLLRLDTQLRKMFKTPE